MFFNQSEIFRHSFGRPREVAIRGFAKDGDVVFGVLMDISLKGIKLFAEKEMKEKAEGFQLSFIVHQETIRAEALLVWKKRCAGGWMYGMEFKKDPIREMVLTNELAALKKTI